MMYFFFMINIAYFFIVGLSFVWIVSLLWLLLEMRAFKHSQKKETNENNC